MSQLSPVPVRQDPIARGPAARPQRGAYGPGQAIRDLLLPVHQQLTQLLTMVNSTLTLAGSDLMKASLIIYRSLLSHGEEVGLKEVRDELARRFAKAPRPAREDESAAATSEILRRS